MPPFNELSAAIYVVSCNTNPKPCARVVTDLELLQRFKRASSLKDRLQGTFTVGCDPAAGRDS